MLENPSASELAQRIDRRRLLQRIGATVGVAGSAAILAPSLSVSAYAATGASGSQAQQSAGNDQAPAASFAGSSAAAGAGAAGDASSPPSSSLDDSGSAGAAGAGADGDASSLPSSSLDDSGSAGAAGAGAAGGGAQAQSAGSATLTNYDD